VTNSWLVLTPPIIVLVIAFITKKLNPALITGIICAALIAADFNIIGGTKIAGTSLWERLIDLDSIFIYSFLIMLGIVIALVGRSGGAAAFARVAAKKLRSAKQAETSSIFLSFGLFIDDYLSNTTVGYVMRPLTDSFKVARAKLAFLVHSIATPLVVLAPISGWSAMITSRLDLSGISPRAAQDVQVLADPFFVYVRSIPFIFYSFLMIVSVWFIVRRRISFGPMRAHETIAQKTGNLLGGKEDNARSIDGEQRVKGTLADLFVPLVTLIGSITFATLYSQKLVDALGINVSPSFFALFMAGLFTLIVSFLFSLGRKKMTIQRLPNLIWGGVKLMVDPIIMLFLASTLGLIITNNLHTGDYLAGMIMGTVSIALIPFMLFVASTTIAVATGTSWGTIAIMVPIMVPMVITLTQADTPATLGQIALLLPSLGAVLSGAVCGDHISPVSETTIMAASSAGSDPVDHATTQFFYALPAVLCSGLAFLISGLLIGYSNWINCTVSIGISLTICLASLYMLNKAK